MIKKLQHDRLAVSEKIRAVFQASYAVEAKLLKAIDFPPLKRPLNSYVNSDTVFFGYIEDQGITGVIEITHNDSFTHINSLVVDPEKFRQGIATKLMAYVFETYDAKLFVVETGLDNGPATSLYNKFGFTEVKQWGTDHGVRKIKFERRMTE